MRRYFILSLLLTCTLAASGAKKPKFDYSLVSVPEEGGVRFEKITDDADCVCSYYLVHKNVSMFKSSKTTRITWWINPQIALSPNGERIAYINYKNGTSNIMIKSSSEGGASTQRTFRTNVEDVTWSPDGKTLCFTEVRNNHHGIYMTDAEQGSIVRQISNGTENDFSGVFSEDCGTIYFHRGEGFSSFSLWSYDRSTNLFTNYSRGMTPIPDPDRSSTIYCTRFTDNKESEIWRINFETGVEELILSLPGHSFSTPQLSPDGRWLLCTGDSRSEKEQITNTDIFAIRTDGTGFTQLTYHPGNDLSAIWAPDGRSIYFLSQRGSQSKTYNVWRMDFNL